MTDEDEYPFYEDPTWDDGGLEPFDFDDEDGLDDEEDQYKLWEKQLDEY